MAALCMDEMPNVNMYAVRFLDKPRHHPNFQLARQRPSRVDTAAVSYGDGPFLQAAHAGKLNDMVAEGGYFISVLGASGSVCCPS